MMHGNWPVMVIQRYNPAVHTPILEVHACSFSPIVWDK